LRAFFVQKSFLCLEFGFERTFVQKTSGKNVDEIEQGWWNEKKSCKVGGQPLSLRTRKSHQQMFELFLISEKNQLC